MGKNPREPASAKKKANSTGTYSPVQIKEGEILTDVTRKQWRVGKPVGSGGFGEIYLVSSDVSKPVQQDAMYAVKIEPHESGPLFVEMNFYIRVAKQEMITQWMKERDIKILGMPHYITFGSHYYQGEKYRFLVLKRFGQDLGKVFDKCKRKFHIKTVLTLGIRILDILEYIHSHGYIHADIKASNLLLGYDSKDGNNIYLLDYGLACRYIDSYGRHKEYNPDQRRAHDGTLEYTSRDAHVGAHSRRGDLEVLAYNMLQWLSGRLPWEDEMSDPEKVALEKNNCMNNIPLFLKTCFGDDAPVVMHHFLKYVVSLNFDTKPDYDYCRTLLRQGIRHAGYSDDGKLNLTTVPAKLKASRKRYRDSDAENLVELKPVKLPRTCARQPCVPVQPNCNRMTRQQVAASGPALRWREKFDWVKVLQFDPESLLKSCNTSQDQSKGNSKKKRENKNKSITVEAEPKAVKKNPLDNLTPAMFEVLKLRCATPNAAAGKRNRSDSNCNGSVLYEKNSLTPAMEEVIRRRELLKRVESENEFRPVMTATSARANRLRIRNESKLSHPRASKAVEVTEVKKTTTTARKISAPGPNTSVVKGNKGKTRKYSLPEQKELVTEERVVSNFELNGGRAGVVRRASQRIKKKMHKCRKRFPTLPKYVVKKRMTCVRSKRRREVSPSETNFVPRLRSGFDSSEDFEILAKISGGYRGPGRRIRNYAAKEVGPIVTRARKSGIKYSLPPLRGSGSLDKRLNC